MRLEQCQNLNKQHFQALILLWLEQIVQVMQKLLLQLLHQIKYVLVMLVKGNSIDVTGRTQILN